MFASTSAVHANDGKVSSMENRDYVISWRGLIYMDGVPAGIPSIERLAENIAENLPVAVSRVKGVYFLLVHEKLSGKRYALVDNAGLFHAFYSDRYVSTSFLEIAAAEEQGASDLDPEALVEFFHFGHVASGGTLFHKIRKINPDQIVSLSAEGKLDLLPKPVCNIGIPAERSLEECLKVFAGSVGEEKISLDLTGGFDSRLLAVALQYFGLPFEVAVSGVNGNTELIIAEQVAEVLGRDLHITHHNLEDFEISLPEMFRVCDGLFDPVRYHRSFQLQHDRLTRGITLMISAVGGELFKDFWWLQDFPCYNRRKPNLDKLYAFRIAPIALKHFYLGEPYRRVSEGYRRRLLQKLSAFVVPGNTHTYDQIYYSFKMREYAGRFISSNARLLQCCAPYLERDAVAFGYQLPRSRRFFNNFHRDTITRLNPAAARIPTTEGGISASSHVENIAADLSKYAIDKLRRLTRKVGQTIFRRSYLRDESPNHPELFTCVRNLAASRGALERLKDYQIVSGTTTLKDIEDGYLGNILALSMLLEWVQRRASSVEW